MSFRLLFAFGLMAFASVAFAHGPNEAPHQSHGLGDFKLDANKSNAILMVTAIGGNHYHRALKSIKAKTLILAGPTDLLNPEYEASEAAHYINDVRSWMW